MDKFRTLPHTLLIRRSKRSLLDDMHNPILVIPVGLQARKPDAVPWHLKQLLHMFHTEPLRLRQAEVAVDGPGGGDAREEREWAPRVNGHDHVGLGARQAEVDEVLPGDADRHAGGADFGGEDFRVDDPRDSGPGDSVADGEEVNSDDGDPARGGGTVGGGGSGVGEGEVRREVDEAADKEDGASEEHGPTAEAVDEEARVDADSHHLDEPVDAGEEVVGGLRLQADRGQDGCVVVGDDVAAGELKEDLDGHDEDETVADRGGPDLAHHAPRAARIELGLCDRGVLDLVEFIVDKLMVPGKAA